MKPQKKALAFAAALVISLANVARARAAATRPHVGSAAGANSRAACADMDQDSIGKRRHVDRF